MGSYWAAVMGKTTPFGTFLVTARPGSYGGGYDRFFPLYLLKISEKKRQETQTKLPERKERQTDSWAI